MSDHQMMGVVFGTLSPVEKVVSYRLKCNACDAEYLVPATEAHVTRCECETAKKQVLDASMPTLPADPPKKIVFKRLTNAELQYQARQEWRAAKARSIV